MIADNTGDGCAVAPACLRAQATAISGARIHLAPNVLTADVKQPGFTATRAKGSSFGADSEAVLSRKATLEFERKPSREAGHALSGAATGALRISAYDDSQAVLSRKRH